MVVVREEAIPERNFSHPQASPHNAWLTVFLRVLVLSPSNYARPDTITTSACF